MYMAAAIHARRISRLCQLEVQEKQQLFQLAKYPPTVTTFTVNDDKLLDTFLFTKLINSSGQSSSVEMICIKVVSSGSADEALLSWPTLKTMASHNKKSQRLHVSYFPRHMQRIINPE